MEVRTSRKLCTDFRMFVSYIIIDHQMGVEVRRNIRLNMFKEAEEFLVAVTGTALCQHLTVRNVESANKVVVPC